MEVPARNPLKTKEWTILIVPLLLLQQTEVHVEVEAEEVLLLLQQIEVHVEVEAEVHLLGVVGVLIEKMLWEVLEREQTGPHWMLLWLQSLPEIL